MGMPEPEPHAPRHAGRAASPDFDAKHFRRALSQFATGVTIITTRAASGAGTPFVGITASSFNSVSMDPPLVLWSMATTANSLPMFRDGSHYIINVLSASQLDLCQRFATLKGDRFAGVDYRLSETGLPVLANALAWFECHNRSRYDEGDHIIFVGEVERCGVPGSGGHPLVFHGGAFSTTSPLGD
ncbi:flavin reductase [Cupriavidus sp. USMAA2-4]|uniref:Flavin reductase n=1 Tax=Cupriavidus malaysiensis TaxID=367825 RepID=A0ABN4TRC3_9BURK|nr:MULTISPECIES: flavin reductase family protein [Cupriavidus]AOY93195.1 flavin reductase [Cupriavidus sp. USMAA2-4]AOZ00514.1 flavin reductase [Cupriavidus sp. USMAHM13]AOZ07261.1 flavin reductase [Cupriavidus malaysiensis]